MDSLLDEIGDAEKAKELFRKALSIEPSHMQCTLYMGEVGNKSSASCEEV